MNTKFTPKLDDTTCASCFCKDQKFLHHVWVGDKCSKICTSCVLFANKHDFCPECFDFSPKGDLTTCERCQSSSHTKCFSNSSLPGAPSVCATCRDPKRLVFRLSDLKMEGDIVHKKGIDLHASKLLLTAAKIAHQSISRAREAADDDVPPRIVEDIDSKGIAQRALKRVLKFDESNDDGPFGIDDLIDSEEDSSPKTV